MSNHVDQFLRILESTASSGAVADVSPLCENLASDIVGDLSFGHAFNTQTQPHNRILFDTLHEWMWLVNSTMQLYMLKTYCRLRLLWDWKSTLRMMRTVKSIVDERMKKDTHAVHDFYSVSAEEFEVGKGDLVHTVMWSEAINFLIAGGTTVSGAMYPEWHDRVTEEVRSAFDSGADIVPGPQLASCKLLRACMEEAMRCAPPVTTTPWRQQDKYDKTGNPYEVAGHVIPKGTLVGINFYALFHNEELYPDSYVFKPERFLDVEDGASEEEKEAKALMRKAFVPFSIGERGCAGKAMAWAEMTQTIARTLWYFDFEKAPGEAGSLGEVMRVSNDGSIVPEYKLEDIFGAIHHGPNLVFRQREKLVRSTGN
ncbi:hypothetical protein Golomagni_06320 [Golovinomyces magnicellulatus]|nr:hypothetical protein Golomagni_06320 [Golovinomyces magnicellulatus]